MIHQAELSVDPLWQKELKTGFSRASELLAYLQLDPAKCYNEEDEAARNLFAMRVPKPFVDLMNKGDRLDPLLLQVLPVSQEFHSVEGFVADPLLEQNNDVAGLLHKYKSRVLLIFKGGCAVNCRYCFRRHFPYQYNQVNKQQLKQHLQYIAQHPEINEVILSGGDPLMAKDETIRWFVDELEQIVHVTRLRIHTRLPVVIPSRVTDELLSTLRSSRLKPIVVLHINHANEVGEQLKSAARKMRTHGITLLNQAVLLKGINDNIGAQVDLSEALFSADILPYYLHLFDKVDGAAHFYIDDNDAKDLYRQILTELPGFLVPKLVREIGGETSKTPVLPY